MKFKQLNKNTFISLNHNGHLSQTNILCVKNKIKYKNFKTKLSPINNW